MRQVEIENAPLTILISIDGQIHLTAFKRDQFEVLSDLLKNSMQNVIPTKATQSELNKLLRGEKL